MHHRPDSRLRHCAGAGKGRALHCPDGVTPDDSYFQQTITFHLDGVQAQETDTFIRAGSPVIDLNFSLTFDRLPGPTPTPTPIPPTPTATPQVAQSAAYSRPIVVEGGTVPEGAVLVARIGSYESEPALIEGEEYGSLVLNPRDFSLVGQTVEFLLNRVKSGVTDVYESGSIKTNFGLVFIGLPTPTRSPTATPTPLPTLTPLRPTPRPTAVPPTPTGTPVISPPSPTNTPVIIVVPSGLSPTGPADDSREDGGLPGLTLLLFTALAIGGTGVTASGAKSLK